MSDGKTEDKALAKVPKKKLKKKNKAGRPKGSVIKLSKGQKLAAIAYVIKSGLYKMRLTKYLGVDLKTLNRILGKDKVFSRNLETAEAEFAGNIIDSAKSEFILKTKYKEEFPEITLVGVEHSLDERLAAQLDRIAKLTTVKPKQIDGQATDINNA